MIFQLVTVMNGPNRVYFQVVMMFHIGLRVVTFKISGKYLTNYVYSNYPIQIPIHRELNLSITQSLSLFVWFHSFIR